ncbi:MAG: outer membrane protein transport protein [Myxococcota bacterium]|nr:outer membrane protein transport protein [Myxococcota bacterium]
MLRCLWVLILLTSAPSWGAGFFRPGVGVGNLAAGGTGVSGGVVGYGHWYNPAMLSLTKGKADLVLDWTMLDESFSYLRSREGLVPPERLADMSEGQQAALMANCCGSSPDQPVLDEAPARQIPFIGLAVPVRPDTVVGLAVYGPQGPARKMDPNGAQRYSAVSNNITLAIAQLSAAYGADRWGVGIGLANFILDVGQDFTLSGDFFGTEDPAFDALATVQVQDAFIPVANLGFWAAPFKGLRLGASWQRPLTEKCTGTGASKICGNVIAEGVVDAELGPGLAQAASIIQNDGGALVMRFPDMIRLGATQQFGDRVNVSLEGFYEAWGEIGNLTFVPNNVVFDAGVEQISLENIVFPRRWDNTYGVRFGTRWDLPAAWTQIPVQMRLGSQWESSAAPLVELDTGGLDWEKLGFTVGFGVEVMKGLHVDAYYLRTLTAELTVQNSNMRTTNIFHADEVAKGNSGLETVSANGDYVINHQRFGLGVRYALGVR